MQENIAHKQIYDHEKRRVEQYKAVIKRSSLPHRNKELILEFSGFCSALGNSPARIGIVLRHLLIVLIIC